MYKIIEKRLTVTERERHWIKLSTKIRKIFPQPHTNFTILINNEPEETYLDNYNRIMLGSTIFYKYNFDEPGTLISIEKNSDGYFIIKKCM